MCILLTLGKGSLEHKHRASMEQTWKSWVQISIEGHLRQCSKVLCSHVGWVSKSDQRELCLLAFHSL